MNDDKGGEAEENRGLPIFADGILALIANQTLID